jgi:hypothetical protein
MVYELRQYWFEKESWDSYYQLFKSNCIPVRGNAYGVLKGAWFSCSGSEVIFTHIWEYETLDHRTKMRQELAQKPEWSNDFLPKAAPLISRQKLAVLYQENRHKFSCFSGSVNMTHIRCNVGTLGRIKSALPEGLTNKALMFRMEFPDPNVLVIISESSLEDFIDLSSLDVVNQTSIELFSLV